MLLDALKTVSALLRNVQHTAVLGGEFHTGPFAVRGGIRPQIERHVEDSASSAANQLRLKGRRYLKVHASNGALADTELHVCLHRQELYALLLEFPHTPRPLEVAAIIAMGAGINDPSAAN
jgi:hypothetical protein